MGKRVGRSPVEVNISAPQDNHIPIFDIETRLWNTIATSSLFTQILTGSNNFSGSQTILGDLTVSGSIFAYNITSSLFGTASWARNTVSASYLSGSTAIVDNFTSSRDIRISRITIGLGRTGAFDNIVIGSGSLQATSSYSGLAGDNNIAIGNKSLTQLIIGDNNVAIGYSALQYYTGSFSTAVGAYALWRSPSGRNTAFGQGVMPYLVTGSNNTGVGDAVMFYLIRGTDNTAIGNVALRDLEEGNQNTVVGSGALYRFFVSGSANTVIGFDTAGGIKTGSFNTIIGAKVKGLPDELYNNIIISDGQGNIKARYSSSVWTLSDSTVGNFTGSLLGTSSWAQNSLTASFSPNYLPLTGGTINGDVIINGTASISLLNVLYETASVIYSSGSNQFGDAADDVQTLYGTVIIPTGSLVVSGSITTTAGVTASLFGTASWANNAVSAAYAATASYILNAISASYALSASQAQNAISSSYPFNVTGSSILSFNTSEVNNTYGIFIGENAGYQATNAFNSHFIGVAAGYSASNAYYANFIGQIAGSNARNARYSNFIGRYAGLAASNAENSNFIGQQAGNNATDASNSNFLGENAGNAATNANRSNFLGTNAGSSATNANRSNFLGTNAGDGATSASYSNFLGDYAGGGAQNANRSFFVGEQAGREAINSENSTIIGAYAGYLAASASYSTLIGYQVGKNAAGGDLGIKSNNIIIGTNVTLADGRKDSINLGGLIFGTGSYFDTNTNPFSGSANGRVGINQPLPIHSLDVSGSGRFTDNLEVTGALYIKSPGLDTSSLNLSNSRNLGIDLYSDGFFVGGKIINGISLGNGLTGLYSVSTGVDGGQGIGIFVGSYYGINEIIRIDNDGYVGFGTTSPSATIHISSSNSSQLKIGDSYFPQFHIYNGHVGIGVLIPNYSLDVSGSGRFTNGLEVTGSLVAPSITGSLFGTASWANNAISSSNALTASYVLQAVSASFAVSASRAQNSVSSSYPIAISGSTIYSPIAATNIEFSTTNSIFLGRGAGSYAKNAYWSCFIGSSAGSNALDAAFSNFIGLLAGSNASSSYESNFLGRQAGRSATFANNSNFIGFSAGELAISASYSNFIGDSAGYGATNANTSTFIGSSAGNNAIDAANSNFIGPLAGFNSSNSHTSNFIGFLAGAFENSFGLNISHHSNFIGDYAGYDAEQAYYSNFIGSEVGRQAVSASYSTLIGYRVGRNNILVGQGIKSNNIIIGTNITLNEGRQDSINIGGLIFGTGSYSNINTDPYSGSANGRVGINQPLPLFSLDVSGSGRYTNGLQVTSSLIAPSITGSLFGTASWANNAISSSNALTASFAFNAISASYVLASGVQGLDLFRIATGSISASVNTVRESLFLINSGSNTYINVSSSGNTEIYSSLFIIKDFTTNVPVFTISQSVPRFVTQSSVPTGNAELGALWFTSTDLYIGLE